MKKERLDKYLVDLGYFETKSKASSAILAGHVKINDEYITKAGFQISHDKEYDIQVKSMPFVSRGGFKLKKALDTFPVAVDGRICFDAGASTGGFTDCLLQNGAKFVYAVDVGYGQLDWKIRSDTPECCGSRSPRSAGETEVPAVPGNSAETRTRPQPSGHSAPDGKGRRADGRPRGPPYTGCCNPTAWRRRRDRRRTHKPLPGNTWSFHVRRC